MAEVFLDNRDGCQKIDQINLQDRTQTQQKELTGPQILPIGQRIYNSSIVTTTFQNDIFLVNPRNQSEDRRQLRFSIVQDSLNLGAYQHVLFSAFFYMQKYLNKIGAQAKFNQILPIACLCLARKYQKGKSPNLNSWRQKLKINYQKQQIKIIQDELITTLQFELEPITRYNFMCDLYLLVCFDKKTQNFCQYLLDLSIFLTHMKLKSGQQLIQFSQGQIGLSVVRLACYFFNMQQLQKLSVIQIGYNMERVHQCCNALFQLLLNRKMNETRHTRHKYKKPKFMQVAKIQFLKINSQNQGQSRPEQENQKIQNEVHNCETTPHILANQYQHQKEILNLKQKDKDTADQNQNQQEKVQIMGSELLRA